jgi:LuxR family transcriptional regulator, quorum-sensing system regulator CciR
MTHALNLPLHADRVPSAVAAEAAGRRLQRGVVAVLEEFLDAVARAESVSELVEVYRRATSELGFEYFVWANMGESPYGGDASAVPPPLVAFHVPGPWLPRYSQEGYFSIDPVVRHARTSAVPYEWGDAVAHDSEQRRVMDEACQAGLRTGICVPIHEPQGRIFLASAATSQTDIDTRHVQPVLHMLTVRLHARLREIGDAMASAPCAQLTARERECLLWCARGKSSWDISRLLGISEHTVNFHVKNAMNKLGTSTRVSAVLKSVGLGLITP